MTFNLQQLPNLLTLLRIVLIPVFVVVFFLPFEHARLIATVILFIAGITDWLDGFLARRFELHSPLGAFLDPVADKLMVSTALVTLITRLLRKHRSTHTHRNHCPKGLFTPSIFQHASNIIAAPLA